MDDRKHVIPGTNIGIGGVSGVLADELIRGLLSPFLGFGAGLLLSQITNVANDLSKETIQNWVKRGFVESPKNGKFYDEDQVARILLINSLRGVIELENIKKLLQYVNGDLLDKSDDIIKEKELLELFSATVIKTNRIYPGSLSEYEKVIDQEIINLIERSEKDKEKIKKALIIMVTAFNASFLKKQADSLISKLDS